MSTMTATTQVAAPPERVFAVYTDIEQAAERIPGILSVEVLSEGPVGDGFRWRETRKMFGKEATEEMWITGFEPPRRYTVAAESHGMKYATEFAFEPDGEGTRVTWTFEGIPQTFAAKVMGALMAPLFKGAMRKCMLEDLEALRAVAESGGGASA